MIVNGTTALPVVATSEVLAPDPVWRIALLVGGLWLCGDRAKSCALAAGRFICRAAARLASASSLSDDGERLESARARLPWPDRFRKATSIAEPDMRARDMSRRLGSLAWAIIAGFFLVRLALMAVVGFGIDEDYTLANAQSLALSYFDHPPLHQWITTLTLRVVGFTPWVRLPFLLLFVGTSWSLFRLTGHLFGAEAGIWALLALNLSAFFTVSAGGWVVPDGPLLFALSCASIEMARLFFPDGDTPRPWRRWIAIGAWLGIAGLSKYIASFAPLGLLAFIAASPDQRHWFRHPAPWAGAALAGVIIAPVFIWNAQNHWVSFRFQGGRGLPGNGLHLAHVAGMIGGEVGLLLPWVFVPLLMALVATIRIAGTDERRQLLLCLGLPAIAVLTITPLWGARGLPHWTMSGWFFLFPLLGAWFAAGGSPWLRPRVWLAVSLVAFVVVIGIAASHTSTGWIKQGWPTLFQAGDPTLESLAWTQLRASAAFTPRPDFILTDRWTDAGKLAAAFDGTISVLVIGDDPRQFAFTANPAGLRHKNAVLAVRGPRASQDLPRMAALFAATGAPTIIWLGRGAAAELPIVLMPAKDLVATFPSPYTDPPIGKAGPVPGQRP